MPMPDSEPPRCAATALVAQEIRAFTDAVTSALESASGLDDAGRVESIRALEELQCVASAAQARLGAELDESQRSMQAAAGVPPAQVGRGVASQLAHARRESPHRGQRHLGLANIVTKELPGTWRAWSSGRLTEWKACLIARETACLSREDRMLVDQRVTHDLDKLERMGVRELVAEVQREAYRLDAESFVSRRRLAEADRRVTLRLAPDAMTWLTALVPMHQGVAMYAELKRTADSARSSGDCRGQGQVMADALVARVLEGTAAEPVDPPIALNLVLSDEVLFGRTDEPAHLDSYGPMPGELARELVSGACSRGEKVWLRRLYASEVTGQLIAMDSRSRRFPPGLARFVRLRDQVCRTPWCDAPVRHIDHAEDHAAGGHTSAANAQGLCQACNHAKQATGWLSRPPPPQVRQQDRHDIETEIPTGHRYRSSPPRVLATIHDTAIRIDYYPAA